MLRTCSRGRKRSGEKLQWSSRYNRVMRGTDKESLLEDDVSYLVLVLVQHTQSHQVLPLLLAMLPSKNSISILRPCPRQLRPYTILWQGEERGTGCAAIKKQGSVMWLPSSTSLRRNLRLRKKRDICLRLYALRGDSFWSFFFQLVLDPRW